MAIANWTCFSWLAYAPGTIAVNVTWIEREFNAGQTPRSIYLSVFNRFPVIQAVISKVRKYSTFFAHFGLPWLRPWDYRGKSDMDRKRIQCLSNASQHVPIYLQILLRYSGISVSSDWFSTVLVSEWVFLTIWLSPEYAPGTIAVNVTRIEREFNAYQTRRSMYPSIFNHFWDIAIYRWRVTGFYVRQLCWST